MSEPKPELRRSLNERRWLSQELRPIAISQIDDLMDWHYGLVLESPNSIYSIARGVDQILNRKSINYAKLPPIQEETALQVFKKLKKGSTWLDIGCGSGRFISEVIKEVNPKIQATGFDARTWGIQYPVPELVIGNVDNIALTQFGKNVEGFDLITSVAFNYHIIDYWGVLAKTLDLLKTNGKFSMSSLNRPVDNNGNPIDNEFGIFVKDPKQARGIYYRNRNLFDVDGNLMSLSEVFDLVNLNNSNFILNYKVGNPNIKSSEIKYCGGISGIKTAEGPLDLSNIFYCFYPPNEQSNNELNDRKVSFIVARTNPEIQKLKKDGFVSVQDRLGRP